MTDTLRKAVAHAESLPESGQDAIAALILAEIESDARWDALFERPVAGTRLEQLAAEAMADLDAGRTRPLDDLLNSE